MPVQGYEESEQRKAENWLQKHLDAKGVSRTPANIRDALIKYASSVTHATFRRTRSRLSEHQAKAGFHKAAKQIRDAENPVPVQQRKRSARKAKKVTKEHLSAIMQALDERAGNNPTARFDMQVMLVVLATGVRPAELIDMAFDGDVLVIQSSKQTKAGNRSIPVRKLIIEDPALLSELVPAVDRIQQVVGQDYKKIRAIENRFSRLAEKLWPDKRQRRTLRHFRHRFSSELKAGGRDPREIAALMGHLSPLSYIVYGRRKFGSGGKTPISAHPETLAQVHELTPEQQRKMRSPFAGGKPRQRPAAGATQG